MICLSFPSLEFPRSFWLVPIEGVPSGDQIIVHYQGENISRVEDLRPMQASAFSLP